MILRELSGGGYLLTGALLALSLGGFRRIQMSKSAKRLLLLWIVVPVPLAILGNLLFHYFFATRQLFFIIPPLCLLATEGIRALQNGWRPVVAVTLAAVACVYDVRWFSHSKEDWSLPAAQARRVVVPGTCVLAVPKAAADFYRLYEPSLPFCSEHGGSKVSVVLVAPYATKEQRESVQNAGPPTEMGGTTFFFAKLNP